jgi:hypothetical protein
VYPDNARNPTVASIARMAITTTNSTKVKAENFRRKSERRTERETEEEIFGAFLVWRMETRVRKNFLKCYLAVAGATLDPPNGWSAKAA